jgi:hypothetical protein
VSSRFSSNALLTRLKREWLLPTVKSMVSSTLNLLQIETSHPPISMPSPFMHIWHQQILAAQVTGLRQPCRQIEAFQKGLLGKVIPDVLSMDRQQTHIASHKMHGSLSSPHLSGSSLHRNVVTACNMEEIKRHEMSTPA